MKFIVVFLLSSLTFAIALAFPDQRSAAFGMPHAGLHHDTISHIGTGAAGTPSEATQIRAPRHLLTKLFHSQPQVIVQPIIIQPSSEYGHGRVFSGYSTGYDYSKRLGFW